MNGANSAAPEQQTSVRPMSFSEILDRIWQVFRKQWALFLRIGWVPAGACVIVYAAFFGWLFASGFFSRPPSDPMKAFRLLAIWMMGASLLLMLLYALFQAASCYAAIQLNHGKTATFRESYAVAWRNAGRYVGLMVLQALCVAAPMMLVLAPVAIAFVFTIKAHAQQAPGILFVLGPLLALAYFGGMVYAVWMGLRLALAFPACVAEDIPMLQALKRSAHLTQEAKGRMFLVLLLIYAISYAVFLVFELVVMSLGGVGALFFSAMHLALSQAWQIAAIGSVGLVFAALFLSWMALIWSVYAITLSVIYEDQFLRRDGPAMVISGGLS